MALTQSDFLKLRQFFYTRAEFDEKFNKVYNTLDRVMGELETIRDEVALSASRASVEELEERAEKIEQRLPALY